MARVLYQWIKKRLVRIGEHTSKVSGMPNRVISTLLEAPELDTPQSVVKGSQLPITIPYSSLVSAVDLRYLIYKINDNTIVFVDIEKNKDIQFTVTVPSDTEILTISYCVQDWIENWSSTKIITIPIVEA